MVVAVDEDGNLELRITERKFPCDTDRRTAWWSVIMAMALAILATITALAFALILIRERTSFQNQVNDLRSTIAEQDAALNCRAELNANLQSAIAESNEASVDLLIEVADQFYVVIKRGAPDPGILQQHIETTRDALNTAKTQAAVYDRAVGNCALAKNGGD